MLLLLKMKQPRDHRLNSLTLSKWLSNNSSYINAKACTKYSYSSYLRIDKTHNPPKINPSVGLPTVY